MPPEKLWAPRKALLRSDSSRPRLSKGVKEVSFKKEDMSPSHHMAEIS